MYRIVINTEIICCHIICYAHIRVNLSRSKYVNISSRYVRMEYFQIELELEASNENRNCTIRQIE